MDSISIAMDGTKEWWRDGKLHREDGPAIIWGDSSEEWRFNGELHRTDGPAVIWSNGNQEWYINGKDITTDVQKWMRRQNISWPWNDEIQAQFVLTFI